MKFALSAALAIAVLCFSGGASAQQNTSLPSGDWNGSWGFSSPSAQQFRMLQADIIEKKEAGYYEALGQNLFNVTNNNTVIHDNRQGSFDEITAGDGSQIDISTHVGDEIGQNTNVIGAINNSQTNIEIEGSNNKVTAINAADNKGCQDGSINTLSSIDVSSFASGSASCN
jgi:hypothetical protein